MNNQNVKPRRPKWNAPIICFITFFVIMLILFIQLCYLGLSKKVLLANVLGEFVKELITDTILSSWLRPICYTMQIYFDFSGYSDMAIGLGLMLGFRFLENKMMLLNEWYHSKNDFMSLLFKTPIIENITKEDLIKIEEYISKNTDLGNIKLVRRIYGFVCQNIK